MTKDKRIEVRCGKKLLHMLEYTSKGYGMSKSSYLRVLIINDYHESVDSGIIEPLPK